MSGDVLPNMIYLDHGDNYTFHVHIYVEGADWQSCTSPHCTLITVTLFVKP